MSDIVIRLNFFNSFSTIDKGIALLYLSKIATTSFLKVVSLIFLLFNIFDIKTFIATSLHLTNKFNNKSISLYKINNHIKLKMKKSILKILNVVAFSDALLSNNSLYYINTIPNSTTITVSLIANSGTPVVLSTATFASATFRTGPIVTITDPNATIVAPTDARQGDGVLGHPTFTNRGTGYQTLF